MPGTAPHQPAGRERRAAKSDSIQTGRGASDEHQRAQSPLHLPLVSEWTALRLIGFRSSKSPKRMGEG